MPQLEYESERFTIPAVANGWSRLCFSRGELMRAAITVGRTRAVMRSMDRFLRSEIKSRIHFIDAHLDWSDGTLRLSDLYQRLDPSEKGCASYRLGMTLAKLFASKLLGVDWLAHWDLVMPRTPAPGGARGQRPDLLGWASDGSLCLIEAKGRSNGFSRSAYRTARDQVRNVFFRSLAPPLRIALQAYSDADGKVKVRWRDPESEATPIEEEIDAEGFFKEYYRLVEGVVAEGDIRRIEDRHYRCVNFPEYGITVGLDVDYREILREPLADVEKERSVFMHDTKLKPQLSGADFSLGSDGIIVISDPKFDHQGRNSDFAS